MFWCVSPWVYPVCDFLGFLDLGGYFFPHFREVFNYYLLKYFLMVFLYYSSGTPMIRMLGHLTLSQRSLRLSSLLLILFFLFALCFIYFYHSVFYLSYAIFCLPHSTVGSLQRVFDLIYCIIRVKIGPCVRLFATPWTIQSMEFSRLEYWSG